MKKLRVSVADLDDDAVKCGLTKDAIERRIIQSIQLDTDIKFVNSPRLPLLKVEALVARPDGFCVAHLLTQVVMTENLIVPAGVKRAGTVELFRTGSIEASTKTDGKEILDAVEKLGRRFSRNWNNDNP